MPRRTRDYMLRHADQALNDLERALSRLEILRATYGEIRPEYSQAVELIAATIVQAHDFLDKFRHNVM